MKKLIISFSYSVCFFLMSPISIAQTINLFAGTGITGFSGNGGAATAAQLAAPYGVAVDANGNVYIADFVNHQIRKVNISGVITTFAGTPALGFSGDGGAATSAQLNYPIGVAADGAGNIYIADNANHRIRKVNNAGIISTFAGTGVSGFSGDGSAANLAQIDGPMGVATDPAGNVYIVDAGNDRIRKVNISGVISTIAGTGVGGFSGDGAAANLAQINNPSGVVVDAIGNIYISDMTNHRIRKINTSGIISTYAGTGTLGFSGDGGAATSAQINYPRAISVDISGNVHVADASNHRIRKINNAGVISTIVGTGTLGYSGDGGLASSAQINYPRGIAFDGTGNEYIADADNNRIRKISCIAPTITATSSRTLMCIGESATLTASGATSYTWNPGGTGSSIVVSPTSNTTYTVTGINGNNCSNISLFTQNVSACTTINQLTNISEQISIYPNPYNSKLTLLFKSTVCENCNITVFSSLGTLIHKQNITSSVTEIDLGEFSSGIYFIKIYDGSTTFTKKIKKE